MKLAIVITDGVGYRNFIMSDFLENVVHEFDEISIYSGLPKSVYANFDDKIKIYELDVFYESKTTWFFRKWKELAHLQKHKKYFGMKDNLNAGYPSSFKPSAVLLKFLYFLTKIWHQNSSILFAEKLQFLSFANNKVTKTYLNLVKNDNPDHVFFTHQRPSYLAPLLYAFIKNKIKSTTFIFSWDNLSSKGRMLGRFDNFLVWSDLMQSELLHFYENVTQKDITVVGTPQFEPYVLDKYKTERKDFFEKFNLDESKKVICFSCADVTIGPNDGLVIQTIAEAMRTNKIKFDTQLIVRTSPAESDARFKDLRNKYPEIRWNVPNWELTRIGHAEDWSQRIPKNEDIKDLRALLENVDLNINMCSTMSLDFMIFDKPVINTVFGNKENGLYNDQRFLGFHHFKKVIDSGAVAVAKNENELIEEINKILENPNEKIAQQKELIKLQISKSLEGTSKRIVEALKINSKK